MKDLTGIINEGNYINKFNDLINIYNKINNKQINNETEIDKEGNKYIGEFKNGLRNGKGILYYNSKDYYKRNRYEGEWKNGLREGKGILYWNSANKYEGDFKKDEIDGKGILYWKNGDKYEGDFIKGKEVEKE